MNSRRSFAIDEYLSESQRTCLLIYRADGSTGIHDIRTGRLLGVVQPKSPEQIEDPQIPGAGALLWGTVCLVCAVVGFVLYHIGVWAGRSHY